MAKPLVSDGLWERIEPLLPRVERRYRYPGRKRVPDRAALTGILFVLKTGIPWEDLPQEMGCGSGMTCWRRLRDWNEAGVWQRLHELLLAGLRGRPRQRPIHHAFVTLGCAIICWRRLGQERLRSSDQK